MTPTADKEMQGPAPPASPELARANKDLLIAQLLLEHVRDLPKEAMDTLLSLAPEIVNCKTDADLEELAEAVREVLFPQLIGDINVGAAGDVSPTENLKRRMAFIGGKIKEIRKSKDWNQEKLAEVSGLPQSHISRLENGQHSPSHKTLERIAKALDVQIGQIDPSND